jgi:hypothetical protein
MFRHSLVPLCSFLLLFISPRPISANDSKAEGTPCFWQRDPEADFDNEGRNHCTPVAIADGLVYLATSRGYDELVEATDHDGQVALITELAEEMATDPKEGTNPDKILTGLISYAEQHGFAFKRLELATWRGVSRENNKYKIATKPSLSWIASAAEDPNTVEVLNFGWYKEEADGRYSRHSGHWVNVVGAGPGTRRLSVHNPLLTPERQEADNSITLMPVDDDFVATQANAAEMNMSGYYKAEGPGLPFSKQNVSAAVLDSVVVFKLEKQ